MHEEGGGVESFHRHTAVVVVVPTFVVFVIENVNKHFQSLLRGARTKTKTNKPLGVLAGVGANKLCSYSGEGTNRFQIIPNFEALFVHLPAGEIFLFVDLATLNYLIFNELWFSMHYFCSGFHNKHWLLKSKDFSLILLLLGLNFLPVFFFRSFSFSSSKRGTHQKRTKISRFNICSYFIHFSCSPKNRVDTQNTHTNFFPSTF